MKIAVEDGFIQIKLQFPQKKKMMTTELLNGISFPPKQSLLSPTLTGYCLKHYKPTYFMNK
jgi:hypothetical protein